MNLFARILRLSGYVGFSLLLTSPILAAEKQPVMVVLDGSNSMWGQIEGKNKIVIARESLDTLLEGASNDHSFGLITYGGRRTPSCSGVNLVGGPGEVSRKRLLNTANKLKPKGRSPIAASMKHAAKQLKGNGSMLLISDGTESCGGNPCQTAKDLKQRYPNLTIDVLGFRQGSKAQLECITENTGGRFVLAHSTASIGELFSQLKPLIAQKAAEEATQNNNDTTGETQQQNQASTNENTDRTPGGLSLSLGEYDGQEALSTNFYIYDQDDNLVNSFIGQTQVDTTLPAGTYKVNALWKEFRETQMITIRPRTKTNYRFTIANIGTVSLSATLDGQQAAANFAIYDKENNAIAHHVMLDNISEKLPTGQYRIKATLGSDTQEAQLVIPEGQQIKHNFNFVKK